MSKIKDYSKLDERQIKNTQNESVEGIEYSLENNNFTKNIKQALSKNYVTGKTYFGVVKDSISKKIKIITGIDVSGRKHVLSNYDIRHMLKEHGNPVVESKKGQIAITEKDIKKIPDIISNPTNITSGTDNRLGKTIRYIKKYNDNSTTVVEVVPSNSKSLIIKTMWKKPSTLTNNQSS